MINFKRLVLTDLKVEIPRIAKKKILKEAFEAAGPLPKLHSPLSKNFSTSQEAFYSILDCADRSNRLARHQKFANFSPCVCRCGEQVCRVRMGQEAGSQEEQGRPFRL